MNDQVDYLFEQLSKVTPPQGLDDRILGAVAREVRRRKLWVGAGVSALSLTLLAVVLTVRYLGARLAETSTLELLRLAVSDGALVAEDLGSWAMAVAESLPVLALVLVAGSIFAAAAMLQGMIRLARTPERRIRQA